MKYSVKTITLLWPVFGCITTILMANDLNNEQYLNEQKNLANDQLLDNYHNNQSNNRIFPLENQMSLTYGSLLNVNCLTNDDCILKNSICNFHTKRCECDFNAIPNDNKCQTLQCVSNQDCWTHFENTICVFGSCRCKLGLKANGKCVALDVPGFNSKTMPDWGISLIAIGALLSGIWGGRSPFMAQLGRQLLSLMVIIVGYMARRQQQQNNPFTDEHLNDNFPINKLNEQNGSQLIIDNLQSALLSPNDHNNDGNDSHNNNDNKHHQSRRTSYYQDGSINSSKKNSTTQTEDV